MTSHRHQKQPSRNDFPTLGQTATPTESRTEADTSTTIATPSSSSIATTTKDPRLGASTVANHPKQKIDPFKTRFKPKKNTLKKMSMEVLKRGEKLPQQHKQKTQKLQQRQQQQQHQFPSEDISNEFEAPLFTSQLSSTAQKVNILTPRKVVKEQKQNPTPTPSTSTITTTSSLAPPISTTTPTTATENPSQIITDNTPSIDGITKEDRNDNVSVEPLACFFCGDGNKTHELLFLLGSHCAERIMAEEHEVEDTIKSFLRTIDILLHSSLTSLSPCCHEVLCTSLSSVYLTHPSIRRSLLDTEATASMDGNAFLSCSFTSEQQPPFVLSTTAITASLSTNSCGLIHFLIGMFQGLMFLLPCLSERNQSSIWALPLFQQACFDASDDDADTNPSSNDVFVDVLENGKALSSPSFVSNNSLKHILLAKQKEEQYSQEGKELMSSQYHSVMLDVNTKWRNLHLKLADAVLAEFLTWNQSSNIIHMNNIISKPFEIFFPSLADIFVSALVDPQFGARTQRNFGISYNFDEPPSLHHTREEEEERLSRRFAPSMTYGTTSPFEPFFKSFSQKYVDARFFAALISRILHELRHRCNYFQKGSLSSAQLSCVAVLGRALARIQCMLVGSQGEEVRLLSSVYASNSAFVDISWEIENGWMQGAILPVLAWVLEYVKICCATPLFAASSIIRRTSKLVESMHTAIFQLLQHPQPSIRGNGVRFWISCLSMLKTIKTVIRSSSSFTTPPPSMVSQEELQATLHQYAQAASSPTVLSLDEALQPLNDVLFMALAPFMKNDVEQILHCPQSRIVPQQQSTAMNSKTLAVQAEAELQAPPTAQFLEQLSRSYSFNIINTFVANTIAIDLRKQITTHLQAWYSSFDTPPDRTVLKEKQMMLSSQFRVKFGTIIISRCKRIKDQFFSVCLSIIPCAKSLESIDRYSSAQTAQLLDITYQSMISHVTTWKNLRLDDIIKTEVEACMSAVSQQAHHQRIPSKMGRTVSTPVDTRSSESFLVMLYAVRNEVCESIRPFQEVFVFQHEPNVDTVLLLLMDLVAQAPRHISLQELKLMMSPLTQITLQIAKSTSFEKIHHMIFLLSTLVLRCTAEKRAHALLFKSLNILSLLKQSNFVVDGEKEGSLMTVLHAFVAQTSSHIKSFTGVLIFLCADQLSSTPFLVTHLLETINSSLTSKVEHDSLVLQVILSIAKIFFMLGTDDQDAMADDALFLQHIDDFSTRFNNSEASVIKDNNCLLNALKMFTPLHLLPFLEIGEALIPTLAPSSQPTASLISTFICNQFRLLTSRSSAQSIIK
eukprot:m.74458 g.74458  ORF g.74458 m.74458 type:complete len:1297 (-) comp8453_c5_seq3:1585-5475(-)